MKIAINIPDETAEWAQTQGLTPEGYVDIVIAARNMPPRPELTREEDLAAMKKFIEEISRNSENIPVLPDEAFTRESFYCDRD
jgi:hypothetical protein